MTSIPDKRRVVDSRRFQRQRRAEVLAWFGAVVICAGLWFNGFDNASGNALICLGSSLIAALVLALRPPRMAFWRAGASAWAFLFAAWLWAALASAVPVGPALAPDLAFSGLVGLAGCGAALLAGSALGSDERTFELTYDRLLGLGGLVTLTGLALGESSPLSGLALLGSGQGGRFAGTFGNANVAGTFYASLTLLALARLRAPLGRGNRQLGFGGVMAVATGLLALLACAATASRAAMATALLGGAILISVGQIRNFGQRRWTIILAIIATLALAIVIFDSTMLERGSAIGADWAFRQAMWSRYLDLALQSPVWGYGLESFPLVNLKTLQDPTTAAQLWSVNAAHNILIQLALDAGLPYLAAVVSAFMIIVGTITRAWSRSAPLPTELGVAGGVGVITCCGMVDIALDVPAIMQLFWFLLGLIWGAALNRACAPSAGNASD